MHNNKQKLQRQRRIRVKVQGTNVRPRVSIFRSNTSLYAQVIDDAARKTLLIVSDKHLAKGEQVGTKSEKAKKIGLKLATLLLEQKIKQAVFDKGSYRYHGRVKAVADGIREGGITV